jgi:hypothetical protein
LAAPSDFVVVAAAAGLVELFGLKKSASVFFGDPAGLAAGDVAVAGLAIAAFLRDFLAGDADASAAVLLAGEVSAAAVSFSFFRDFFAGEADASADGDSPAAGDASVFALRECLAGDPAAVGLGD